MPPTANSPMTWLHVIQRVLDLPIEIMGQRRLLPTKSAIHVLLSSGLLRWETSRVMA